jgi:HPt (histidine-containing phosphotransfer) domain-containing protein
MSETPHKPSGPEDHAEGSLRVDPFAPRSVYDLKRQLENVWQQSRPIIMERLERLDAFVRAVEDGSFTHQQHEDATTLAHTFAGSLSMFGYPGGTELARSMEQWLNITPSPNAATLRDYVAGLHAILAL